MSSSPCPEGPGARPAIREHRRSIPADQRVRLVGALDALRHSSRMFELVLVEGERVRGVLAPDAGEIAEVGALLGSQVTVEGTAKFRASGRVLRIDADRIVAATGESDLWSAAPRPLLAPLSPAEVRAPQGPRSGIAAIFGRWPGDEADAELEARLRQIS